MSKSEVSAAKNYAALLSKLSVASAVIGNLPELPGYNGSILTIDDTEAARIEADLDEVREAFAELIAKATGSAQ